MLLPTRVVTYQVISDQAISNFNKNKDNSVIVLSKGALILILGNLLTCRNKITILKIPIACY